MPAFNPNSVRLNPGMLVGGPFTNGLSEPAKGTAQKPAQNSAQPQSTTLGAQAVRATGSGPFDSAYRQNLATYAGGGFARPSSGVLAFNPTDQFQGNPGGSPADLLTQALAGGGYSTPQTPSTPSSPTKAKPIWQQPDWQGWLKGLQNQGGLLRGY